MSSTTLSTSLPKDEAFAAWCAEADYDPDDHEAPHVEAFHAGFGYGHDRGWEGALAWARRNIERTGRVDA